MLDWILSQAVASWNVVSEVVNWTINNPGAAAFWSSIILTLINYVVKLTPTQVDDSLLDALLRALKTAITQAKEKGSG